MKTALFFPADAHEGPVWVPQQHRLYYTTKTHLDGRRRVDIEYLDFSLLFGGQDGTEALSQLRSGRARHVTPSRFFRDANMANGMRLANDGHHLLVAEQGYGNIAGGVGKYHLQTGQRTSVVENYRGAEFSSPNKVIQSKDGHLIMSDPDYAFRQGFRPPPVLEPNLYLLPVGGEELDCFRCGLEMPHGLALSPSERYLFVTDTSNDGAHDDDIELNRRHSVWRFDFDATTPALNGPGKCCFSVDEGVPDGMTTSRDRLLVGGGDGVYVAELDGQLLGKIATSKTAVNLTLTEDDRHLFVTVDDGILLLLDWADFVGDHVDIDSLEHQTVKRN